MAPRIELSIMRSEDDLFNKDIGDTEVRVHGRPGYMIPRGVRVDLPKTSRFRGMYINGIWESDLKNLLREAERIDTQAPITVVYEKDRMVIGAPDQVTLNLLWMFYTAHGDRMDVRDGIVTGNPKYDDSKAAIIWGIVDFKLSKAIQDNRRFIPREGDHGKR